MADDAAQHEITELLRAVSDGEEEAWSRLLPHVYETLRAQARKIRGWARPDLTLQATELVHDAYLKLIGGATVNYQDRLHFYAVAARAMRQVLIDYIKHRETAKAGGGRDRISLDHAEGLLIRDDLTLSRLDEALKQLEAIDPQQARVVELRYFGGMKHEEIAAVLKVSLRTVERLWRSARNWLFCQMSEEC